jgi:carbon storage regulator
MLVLSRCEGQRIVIGEEIVITVLGREGGRVRLGIEAPAAVSIRRSELTPLPSVLADTEGAGQTLALTSGG